MITSEDDQMSDWPADSYICYSPHYDVVKIGVQSTLSRKAMWICRLTFQIRVVCRGVRADRKTRHLFSRSFSQSEMDGIQAGKKAAAVSAVDNHIKTDQIVGIGSGTTIVSAVERIAERVKSEGLKLVCIPTSFQALQLILDHGLVLGTLEQYPELDVAIDGADEVDIDVNCIKGGGGCLLQEKIIASCAKDFYVIADSRKDSAVLGTSWTNGVPLEVVPMCYKTIQHKIVKTLGGSADLRMANRKMGPVVTDNGNFILDWKFPKPEDWLAVNTQLKLIPGIIETGLFVKMAKKVYFGTPEGTVVSRNAPWFM